jgi:hypothetical protein
VFGATAFSTYGGFWLALGIFIVLAEVSKTFAAGLAGANFTNGLAWFLVSFAIWSSRSLLVSKPVTSAPASASATVNRPLPQPPSSTRRAPATAARSSAAPNSDGFPAGVVSEARTSVTPTG